MTPTTSSHDLQASPRLPLDLFSPLVQAIVSTQQGFILTDHTGTIVYVNPAFTFSTGYSSEEALGRKPSFLQSGRHDPLFYTMMWACIDEIGHWQGEIWNRRKDGSIFVEWLNISAVRMPGSTEVTHYCAIFTDVTDRKQEEFALKSENRKLEQLSLIDSLTGVSNRRAFDLSFLKEWERAVRSGKSLSLLLIDVDYFKLYNDIYGHPKGDECLRTVAGLMVTTLKRASDFAARYGGEEFAILLPEVDMPGAVVVARRIRERVQQAGILHEGTSLHHPYVTVSIGCSSIIPTPGDRMEDLLLKADRALYEAKKRGRNRECICT